MNKSEEIAAWKAFAASMPPDSTYSGAWIEEQIEFISADIRADFPVGFRAASMREAEDIRAAAMGEAHEIREDARQRASDEAGRIVDEARQKADRIRALVLHSLREATRTLEA
jgi:cell division septum initiation protein DivIVA